MNRNFVKFLSRRFSIIFLQETCLYRYQPSTLTDIYDNTEFVSGCVDDDAPVPPSSHMRDCGGTCILWHCSLNSPMRKLPGTSVRINVVELKCPMTPFCLANVYLPAQGVAENEFLFEECLDELHEIFMKYRLLILSFFFVATSMLSCTKVTNCVETCYFGNL